MGSQCAFLMGRGFFRPLYLTGIKQCFTISAATAAQLIPDVRNQNCHHYSLPCIETVLKL